jgi:hypothetical protein
MITAIGFLNCRLSRYFADRCKALFALNPAQREGPALIHRASQQLVLRTGCLEGAVGPAITTRANEGSSKGIVANCYSKGIVANCYYVILMDLQYVPAVLTPDKKDRAVAMVEAISKLARDAGVNVFRRFAFMKGLHQVEQISFDRMVDPTDDNRLHDSDWATQRVAWAVKLAIVGGVNKARSSAANIS